MCGICGFASAPEADEAMLRRMVGSMIHRGPDDEGLLIDGTTGLGVRRLAIIDIAGGHQPFFNETGDVAVVLNGEIYNYRALRRQLIDRGHTLTQQSDGEVIAHLYEDMGINLVQRLRGMFTFALYDYRADTLYLARDRFGIKPLFYARTRDGGVAFASDMRSLLASEAIDKAIDVQALWDYFTFQYVPGPHTLISRIHKLEPAHYMRIHHGQVQEVRYWRPTFTPDDMLTMQDAVALIQTKLRESVSLHLASDVPVGAFLSSGVDSSALVALMREHGPVATFSLGFDGATPNRDELSGARAVAKHLGTEHHEVLVTAQRYRDTWPAIVAAMEDPVADPSAPGLYFLSEEAHRYIGVAISGEGADELFGGYPIYRQPRDLRPVARLPMTVRRWARRVSRELPQGQRGRSFLERATTPMERLYLGGAKVLSEDMKRSLVNAAAWSDMAPEDSFDRAQSWYEGTAHLDGTTRMQVVDCHGWLPGDILAKADKMSMAHSLEVRVPYLDSGVFSIASRVPTRFKLDHGATKVALRRAVRDWLPKGVSARPKLGFPVPLRPWLRGPLRSFVHDVGASQWAQELLNRSQFERMLSEHEAGTKDWCRPIYTVVNFLLWYQIFAKQR